MKRRVTKDEYIIEDLLRGKIKTTPIYQSFSLCKGNGKEKEIYGTDMTLVSLGNRDHFAGRCDHEGKGEGTDT